MTTTSMENAGRFVIAEPIKAAWEHANQAFVTAAAAFMSAAFSMQHGVLPIWIAVPLAIGFEWTYLRGLATADKTSKTRWAGALNWSAMITSVVYGILYILGHYNVIPEQPGGWTAFWLAVAHVFPMALLSFCGANLRRVQKSDEVARNHQKLDEEVARNRKLQDAEDELRIEVQRKEAELALWEKGQLVKAQLKTSVAASRVRNQDATATATVAVPKTVFYQGVEYPTITDAAKAHGISRQAMTKRLAKEAAGNRADD